MHGRNKNDMPLPSPIRSSFAQGGQATFLIRGRNLGGLKLKIQLVERSGDAGQKRKYKTLEEKEKKG
jgi:hypothetical protein